MGNALLRLLGYDSQAEKGVRRHGGCAPAPEFPAAAIAATARGPYLSCAPGDGKRLIIVSAADAGRDLARDEAKEY